MNNKIKVLHIITKLELGGAQRNTLYTVCNLNKEKFEVYLISGCGGILDEEAERLKIEKKFKIFFIKELVREINPIKDFFTFIKITNLIVKIKPQIIHTHSSKAGILGRWAGFFVNLIKFKNIKIIHTFHGFSFSKFHNFLVRNFYILLEIITALISDKLIFVSIDNMKTALKYNIGNARKYKIIRSGVKFEEFYNISNDLNVRERKRKEFGLSDEIVITTIGPFKPQKNLKDFIKLARIICDKISDKKIKFFIAGDGEQREFLFNLAKNLGVFENIIFLSWYKDIKGLLSMTDIFVMTSLWEGLPRSTVEALLSGVPVVAYAVDGLNDIIKDEINGYLVEPKNIGSLAEKVISLIKNKEKYFRIKKNTISTIDKSFDIDYMVIQQQELYLELTHNIFK